MFFNSRKLHIESLEVREMLSVNPLGNSDDTAALDAPVIQAAIPSDANAADKTWLNNFLASHSENLYLTDSIATWTNGRITQLNLFAKELTGTLDVSALTALTYLDCLGNTLTTLNVSGCAALYYLRCSNNTLTTLDVSRNTNLEYLYCSSNQLATLNVSNNTRLWNLYCSSNQLATLNVSNNTRLWHLECDNNTLTTLDVSRNTNLEYLYCSSNKLTTLDVSKNTALSDLKCEYNGMKTLYLPKAIGNFSSISYTTGNNSIQVVVIPTLTAPAWNNCAGGVNTVSGSWTAVSNASNYTVQWSTSSIFQTIAGSWTGNATSFSQSGIPAGNYYFRVRAVGNGINYYDSPWKVYGSTTTVYDVDDNYESNDTFETASDLGSLTSQKIINNLVANNNDWFKFTINNAGTATSNIQISSSVDQGDIDLYLYNASGTRIDVSKSTSNNEIISLNGLAAGTYYIRVYPAYGIPNPNYTLTINPPPSVPAPAAPQNLNATATVNSVELKWSAVSANATGYELCYKKSSDSQYTTVSVSAASKTITGLSEGTTYQFQLRAVGPGGTSAWVSKTVTTQAQATAPAAPTGLTVNVTPTQTSIGLKWDAQSGVTGFTLEYKPTSSPWLTRSLSITGSATSVTVTGLTAGTEYQFCLYAKNAAGTSSASTVYKNRTAAAGQNYAVLFAGGYNAANNHSRYYDAIKDLYSVLTTSYGLSKNNIYVVYADGTNSAADQNVNQNYNNPRLINSDMSFAQTNRVYAATTTNFNTVFTTLGNTMTANDHLLFYTFDHGGGTENNTTLTTEETLTGWGGVISDTAVAKNVAKIQQGYVTMVFAQCFSGGILDEIIDPATGEKKIKTNAHLYGMSAANHYEQSWGDAFARSFINAVNPRVGNNLTTTTAFAYAKSHDAYAASGSYSNNGGTYNRGGRYTAGDEHPWGIGESFSIFTVGASNGYNSNSLRNNTTGGDLLVANSATSNTAALELLAGNNVYINYAYSNPQNAVVSATVTVYGREPQTYTINDDGSGSLAENFDLGVFNTGTYSVIVELFVGEEYLSFTNNFTVLTQSADVADTLAAAKDIVFENNTFTTTSFIGDGFYGGKDVDIYSFVIDIANIGKTLVFDSFGGTLNTYIRLFDFNGTELAHSVLTGQNVISTLYYTITTDGLYYIGVSALENTAYSPMKTENGVAGITGSYQLNGRILDTKAILTLNYDFSWIDNIIWTNTADGTNRVSPKSNEDLYVNYKFANIGYATAEAVTNRITITGANGYSVLHDFTSASITAGEFQSLASNYNWGKLAAGDYTITVTLDINNGLASGKNALSALNAEHNSASWSFTVAADGNVVAGKKDGTAQTSAVTVTFAVDEFNRIEKKNSKGKITTTATSYVIKAYAWDAKKEDFSTKVAKTVTVKSTAANTVDDVLTYTLTGLKSNTLYQITIQAKADVKMVYLEGKKTKSESKDTLNTLGEVQTWAVVPNASLKASTLTENSVSVKVSNWGTSGGLWTTAIAAGKSVYSPIKATVTVTKAISTVDTMLVTYKKNGTTQKATLTWGRSSWSGSDVVSFNTDTGIITINGLSPSVKYSVQVQFSRSSEAVAVKATSVSVSTTARKFIAPIINTFQLTPDNVAQVSFNLSQDVNGRAATQYKVEFLKIDSKGKTSVAKTLTVDTNKPSTAWSFDEEMITAYITGLKAGTDYQVRVKALAAKKTAVYNYANLASDSILSEKITA